MVNPFDQREIANAVKLTRAIGEAMMFPAIIKARPTYQHYGENHRPVWREQGAGGRAAADKLRPGLAGILHRMDRCQAHSG